MLTHSEGSFKKDICNPSFTAAAEKFKILSDQGRIRVIWSLHLNQECCVSDLAKILSIHTSALSHQLRVLRHAKIIKGRRIGKHIFYSISDKTVVDMINLFMNQTIYGGIYNEKNI